MSNATKRNTRFLESLIGCTFGLEQRLRRLESRRHFEARRASGNEWEEVAMRASLWFPLVVLMTPYLDPFLMSIPVKSTTWMKHACVCMSVRRDSLRTRHRGHGLAYTYVASMLATFASRILFAAWRRNFVPMPEDLKVGRRLLEATACWAVVNLLVSTPNFEYLCGGSASGRAVRRALFASSAVVKFRQVRRVAGLVEGRAVVEQVFVLAATGAASTFSRAVTNQWVTTESQDLPDVWMTGLGRTVRELRRYALIGTCLIASRAAAAEEITSRLRCRGDVGATLAPMCFDDDVDIASITRGLALTAVLAYIMDVHLASAATAVSKFKRKPPRAGKLGGRKGEKEN